MSVSQINYLPQLLGFAYSLSFQVRQITDLLATDKSRYFAQPRPRIANYFDIFQQEFNVSDNAYNDSFCPTTETQVKVRYLPV